MLQVVLGIIAILLVLSLFATTLMELINSVFSLRGKFLKKGLTQLLASTGRTDTLEAFLNHPRYKQLTSTFLLRERPPSYISPHSFSSILVNVLTEESRDGDIYGQIKDQPLRELLMEFEFSAGQEEEAFKQKIENWYEEVMDRTSGWFKRNNQLLLIILGLGIAVAFDADTISIFQNLSNDPVAQLELSAMAHEYFVALPDSTSTDSLSLVAYQQELSRLAAVRLDALREPLGLGWYAATNPNGVYEWFIKLLGWMITALAISLGAPFWFDLLRKVMQISTSGGLSPQYTAPTFIPVPSAPNRSMPGTMNRTIDSINKKHPAVAATGTKADENIIKSYG